jgi:hypothetical protein
MHDEAIRSLAAETRLPTEVVRRVFESEFVRLKDGARVKDFLVLFAMRRTRGALRLLPRSVPSAAEGEAMLDSIGQQRLSQALALIELYRRTNRSDSRTPDDLERWINAYGVSDPKVVSMVREVLGTADSILPADGDADLIEGPITEETP